MSALFPRWTNRAARGSLLAIALIAVGIPVALMIWVRTSFASGRGADVAQPIQFDHRIHAHSLKIDCRYCHSTAENAASAGMPPTIACVGCHNDVTLQSALLAPVRASLASKRPIAWRRVDALPDFVFFDHSIHVAKGVGCETCHGRVDEMATAVQATSLSMGWCVGCHRDPMPHLRPRAEIAAMGWDATHTGPAADSLRARLNVAYGARRLTNCSTCHR